MEFSFQKFFFHTNRKPYFSGATGKKGFSPEKSAFIANTTLEIKGSGTKKGIFFRKSLSLSQYNFLCLNVNYK